MVNQYKLITQIENIADRASVDSGTSYERYIQLFSIYFDQVFSHTRDFNVATKLARVYGYVPKHQRVGADWEEKNCSPQGLGGIKHWNKTQGETLGSTGHQMNAIHNTKR